ncbi:hypothetical protein, partial [Bradyrhizobium elkanii]|uniref:hypothetical protein n=1 Tax=Bradyrhizobium elkanii TaxID=29448 RepID=UPI002168CFC2
MPMTRRQESQIARKQNPKTQETAAQHPLSCKIKYSSRQLCYLPDLHSSRTTGYDRTAGRLVVT